MHAYRMPYCVMRPLLLWVGLLAFVVTRSMMPIGFMPSSIQAGLPLVLCPGDRYSAVLLQAQQSHHNHHHAHHGHDDSAAHAHFSPDCYFALLALDSCQHSAVLNTLLSSVFEQPTIQWQIRAEVVHRCLPPPTRAPPVLLHWV